MDMERNMQAVRELFVENGRILSVECKAEEAVSLFPGVVGRPLPAHFEVKVELQPTEQSRILVEVWLPLQNWNGDFLGTGNGGSAGNIVALELGNGLHRGYATANTDMGTEPDPDELIGSPERWKDFGYRATHLMTVVGKQITEAFYGRKIGTSLFIGGSTGGQQALSEAQRYPEDYNGILVIAPAHNRTHLHYGFIWNWMALHKCADVGFTHETAQLVTDHLLKKYGNNGHCLPGDRFFTCPQFIDLDPAVFDECEGLTDGQKEALKMLSQAPKDPVTGEMVYPAVYVPGSEAVGLGLVEQSNLQQFEKDFLYPFRWVAGKDYDFTSFDFHKDVAYFDRMLGDALNATSVDLSRFRELGGKLLMIHGMADPIIPYTDSQRYYERVVQMDGGIENTQKYFRYFQIPGLGHIAGGPGVHDITSHGFRATPQDIDHDSLVALSNWVKTGEAPERLLAVAFKDGNFLNGILLDHFEYERPCFAFPCYADFVGTDPKNPNHYVARTL